MAGEGRIVIFPEIGGVPGQKVPYATSIGVTVTVYRPGVLPLIRIDAVEENPERLAGMDQKYWVTLVTPVTVRVPDPTAEQKLI
jgi:hypothetical protein